MQQDPPPFLTYALCSSYFSHAYSNMACYNAVPPPSLEFRRETVVKEDNEEEKSLKDEECCEMKMDGKPDCVSKTQWEVGDFICKIQVID